MGSLLLISTMKVLLFSLLAFLPLGLTKVCIEYCDACDGDADIGIITCKESCTVESKLNQTDLSYLTDDPDNPIEDLTPEMCRAKCQQQSEHDGDGKECEFFHWQEDHEQAEKKCSLQTGCPPRSTCDPVYKHCSSGQLGCSDDCQEVSPCSLTKAEWTHDKFHVFCRDPQGHDINIYMEDFMDENIAHRTVCQTVRKCASWDENSDDEHATYYRKLAVFCDGTAIEQGKGSWTVMNNTGNQELSEAMITTTPGRITEQECPATCADIQLSTYEGQWWADLICENPLVGNLLTPPNHCVLLCDNNFDKTIDCEYDDKGDKEWRDQTGKKLEDESEIACN